MKALLRKLFEGGIQLSGFKQPGRGKMQLEFISYFFKNVFKCIYPNCDHVSITVMHSYLEKQLQGCLSEHLFTLRAGRLPDCRGSCSALRLGILNSLLKASTYKAFLTSKDEYIVSLH